MRILKSFKVFISLLSAIAITAAPVALVGCSSGCKSPTRSAYVASGVTHAAAAASLRGWNDYLGAEYEKIGNLSATDPEKAAKQRSELLDKEKQVSDAWGKYQSAQLAVLTAAQEFAKVPPGDPNAPNAQDRLNAAVAASSATLNAVIDLLRQFGVKTQ